MVKAFEERCKTIYGPSSLLASGTGKHQKGGGITKSSLRKKHDEIIAARKVCIAFVCCVYCLGWNFRNFECETRESYLISFQAGQDGKR